MDKERDIKISVYKKTNGDFEIVQIDELTGSANGIDLSKEGYRQLKMWFKQELYDYIFGIYAEGYFKALESDNVEIMEDDAANHFEEYFVNKSIE